MLQRICRVSTFDLQELCYAFIGNCYVHRELKMIFLK